MSRFFSNSYAQARDRFLKAAAIVNARVESYPIEAECDDELAIDVAIIGDDEAPTVFVSSGVHGVEGFFGSAVQLALVESQHNSKPKQRVRFVLLHSVNPFGFAKIRRVNEENIDLNRNFVEDEADYSQTNPGYARLDSFLNPRSPPTRFDLFQINAAWQILRHGMTSLKDAVMRGQYEFPRGLFFGGTAPSQSMRVIEQHCESWIANSQTIAHIDLHSGLGRFGDYKLLVNERSGDEGLAWHRATFGEEFVERSSQPDGTAYAISGSFGDWFQQRFSDRQYRFAVAEFGTYSALKVLGALRAENRTHHWANGVAPTSDCVKQNLLEAFCPRSHAWRERVVSSSLNIIELTIAAIV